MSIRHCKALLIHVCALAACTGASSPVSSTYRSGAGFGPRPGATASAAPSAVEQDKEITSDGKQTVTVVERPPNVPDPKAQAKPVELTDANCRATADCARVGRCHALAGLCVATSTADCAIVPQCEQQKCKLYGGRCLPAASCKESYGCSVSGLCKQEGGSCVPSADGDCAASEACKERGSCSTGAGQCIAKMASQCQKARACVFDGLCALVAGACAAASDGDCKNSEGCPQSGRCSAKNGVCVASCRKSQLCEDFGLCQEKGARCVALGDGDCEGSNHCKKLGACSRTNDGSCRPGDDVECGRSTACTEYGRCTFHRGRCLARSAAECKASTIACKLQGRCRYDAAKGCVE